MEIPTPGKRTGSQLPGIRWSAKFQFTEPQNDTERVVLHAVNQNSNDCRWQSYLNEKVGNENRPRSSRLGCRPCRQIPNLPVSSGSPTRIKCGLPSSILFHYTRGFMNWQPLFPALFVGICTSVRNIRTFASLSVVKISVYFSSKHNRSLLKMYGMSMPFLFLFVDK